MLAEVILMRLKEKRATSVGPHELKILISHINDLEGIVSHLLRAITEAKLTCDVPFKEKSVLRAHRWPPDVPQAWGDESA